MALPRPFVTKTFTVYAGDVWSTKLAFAVSVTDQFTGENPVGELIVRVKNDDQRKPVKNPSGYYCFTGLAAAKYTVIVQPEPLKADWYFPAEGEIDMNARNFKALNPVMLIELKPKPTYPFPGNATLVRAMARTSAQAPVADAVVTVNGRLEQTQTDANGEFVLYFKTTADAELTINVKKGNITRRREKKIVEGKTTILDAFEFP